MMDKNTMIDNDVYEYIKNNSGNVSSPDVVNHFDMPCNITLFSIERLIEAGKVEKRGMWTQTKLYAL